jgi:Kef-type K+ transport system membrane component KefB
MSKKNKIYWFEGVTEKGVKSLLNEEDSKFRWLRPQRNRRILVALMAVGIIAVAMGSYWPTLKTNMNLSGGIEIIVYSVTAIFVIFSVLVGYLFLRISVRGIGDAPNELLDERQIKVRDTSFRYAYYGMGYLIAGLLILMLLGPELKLFESDGNDGSYLIIAVLFAFSSMPSMVLAWREQDI